MRSMERLPCPEAEGELDEIGAEEPDACGEDDDEACAEDSADPWFEAAAPMSLDVTLVWLIGMPAYIPKAITPMATAIAKAAGTIVALFPFMAASYAST